LGLKIDSRLESDSTTSGTRPTAQGVHDGVTRAWGQSNCWLPAADDITRTRGANVGELGRLGRTWDRSLSSWATHEVREQAGRLV
jgi:hypothetical protein